MEHDLLVTPVITWRDKQRVRASTTLPGAIAKLASGELLEFARVRPHQFHPWSMFLTQLAAIALHRAGRTDPTATEDQWRDLLLQLTDGRHEPWALIVPDLAQPAFFQPPVPENSLDRWEICTTPDEIDMLVTAKRHDVKAGVVDNQNIEAWVYALMTLQTMQGVFGSGKYGIARMKKGYGNRPRVGYASNLTVTSRFLRDLTVIMESWSSQLDTGFSDRAEALTWVAPWDGSTPLARKDLAPHFIEVCRRVRCRVINNTIECAYTTSAGRRCLAETESGDVGDPWIPIARKDGGALTVTSKRGFTYDILVKLLFETDYAAPAAQKLLAVDEGSVVLSAATLIRGQGKTEGLHERLLPIPAHVKRRLGTSDARAVHAQRALARVVAADTMYTHVLIPALRQLPLLTGLPFSQIREVNRFHAWVDDCFFDHLFASFEKGEDDARVLWEATLEFIARRELESAIAACSLTDARRFKIIAAAESMFAACLRKNFPDLVAHKSSNQGATP